MVEAEIGTAAGQIWRYLHTHGAVSWPQLQRGTRLPARLLAMGIGWLAREGKVRCVQEQRVMKFSLQEEVSRDHEAA
jgi:hypothetical protein